MKKILMMTAAMVLAAPAAQAGEQQVYYPYPSYFAAPSAQAYQQSQMQQFEAANIAPPHANRVYPGREMYGDSWGNIPRHPGDYKDAVSRGQWTSGSDSNRLFYGQ